MHTFNPRETPAKGPSRKSGYRVLLIDDNQSLLASLKDGLAGLGHEVAATAHGKDAFRLMYLLEPHAVVTDVIMPDFDSIEAFAELRRIRPGVRIVAMSGNVHLLRLAARDGADRVLAKPFDIKQLDRLIKEIVPPPEPE